MPAADARVVVGCVIDIPPEYDVAEPEIIIERRGELSLTDALAPRHPVEVEHDELDGSVGEVAEEVGSFHAGESSRTLGAMMLQTDTTYEELLAETMQRLKRLDANRLLAIYHLIEPISQHEVEEFTSEEKAWINEQVEAAEKEFHEGKCFTLEEVKERFGIV